ncbi:hypothetical protein AKJ64_03135 [candidate division MSBL1 archaeon SCGC-AAA259E17]|uniref:Uncharacterized protein n=1 Tax=candidate division MSBL1 archaeon SCGC-AAA259E17 TaxID=1698263 RepID=A0A133UE16_9EURY|nr:hypothetical protein AKJ64_03135 [candidate division MSBL1 archaeon SCGC-AAA259E17]
MGAKEQKLDKFKDFSGIDIDLAEETVKRLLINIEDFIEFLDDSPEKVTKDEVKEYTSRKRKMLNIPKQTVLNP